MLVMILYQWAAKHGVPMPAIVELQNLLGMDGTPDDAEHVGKSEDFASSQVILEASRKKIPLWRNNVGAFEDSTGRWIRYGLANESKQMNALIKSGDRIGIRSVLITPAHVGLVLGQFVSREIKKPGWTYNASDPREVAQLKWALAICARGGDAAFATGEGSL